MADIKFTSNVEVVRNQMIQNVSALGEEFSTHLAELVQEKMLYGYQEPHGPDRHTEIVDTGATFDSVQCDVEKVSDATIKATVGVTTPYAIYVHDGTHKLHGRPFLRDGLLDNLEEIDEKVSEKLKQGF